MIIYIIIIIGIISWREALKALYHCGRSVELDVHRTPMTFKYANKATRRGDKTKVQEDEGRRGRGRTGNGNGDSQPVCARWKANPTTCANCGYLASHDVAVSKARAGNEKEHKISILIPYLPLS